jgi:hypothetical protein
MAPYVTSNWGISQNVISTLRDRDILLETGMNLHAPGVHRLSILDCFILSMWSMYFHQHFRWQHSDSIKTSKYWTPIDAKDLMSSKTKEAVAVS